MKMKRDLFLDRVIAWRVAVASLVTVHVAAADDKAVIAHRGASGYLPEHTLVAHAFAYAEGADYLEPDLVMTKDGHLLASHDLTLDTKTDVAEQFPERAREDGRFYAIDFTLEEIKQLRVREQVRGRWPNRHEAIHFQIPTLAELIELVQGLNETTGRHVGIYPELKHSAWHARQGYDFEVALLEMLTRFGYTTRKDAVIVQSFERDALKRLRELGSELRLVQLIYSGSGHDHMVTPEGLERIANYADGVGPPISRIFHPDGQPVENNLLIREAHKRGMVVHPYTARADALPAFAGAIDELLEKVLFEAGADGIFTDHTGQMVRFLKTRRQ